MLLRHLALLVVSLGVSAQASELTVTSCEEGNVVLNDVYAMRSYANGLVKVFAVDQIEPVAASVGVAVTIDRDDEFESFCRYVYGLSDAELDSIDSSYDAGSNSLSLVLDVRSSDGEGEFSAKKLELKVTMGASNEADLVTARLID